MVTLMLPRLVDVSAASRRSASVVGRNLAALKSVYWLLLLSGFVEPLLYLLSIGVGVGALVGDLPLPDGRLVSYAEFVALADDCGRVLGPEHPDTLVARHQAKVYGQAAVGAPVSEPAGRAARAAPETSCGGRRRSGPAGRRRRWRCPERRSAPCRPGSSGSSFSRRPRTLVTR